jgi:hypothetical protein
VEVLMLDWVYYLNEKSAWKKWLFIYLWNSFWMLFFYFVVWKQDLS